MPGDTVEKRPAERDKRKGDRQTKRDADGRQGSRDAEQGHGWMVREDGQTEEPVKTGYSGRVMEERRDNLSEEETREKEPSGSAEVEAYWSQ